MNKKILILGTLPALTETELRDIGYLLTTTTSPDELLELVGQYQPDLILSACPFRDLNALLELLTSLRQQHRDLPFLLVVDSQNEMHFLEALNHGANGYVFKDHLEQLPARIAQVIQRRHEQKRFEQLLQARIELSAFSINATLDELLQKTLNTAERLTGSQIGFFHFVETDQETLWLQMWSSNTLQKMCTAEGKGAHYPVSQAGVWADCMRERRPVIHNHYAALSHRRGLPKGHAPVIRELLIPVIQNDQIFAIIGVGNKGTDYDQSDVEIVSQLAYMAWDIVRRKQAEQALFESEQRLRQVHMLRTFIQNITHEFRTPLTTINTNVYLMARTQELESRKAKEDKVNTQVQRIARLVDMLLLMTELESGDTLIMNAVDMNMLLQTACKEAQYVRGDSPALHYEPQPTLPRIQGDGNYLMKAIDELLDNAYRFTPEAGSITVNVGSEAGRLWITVRDTGEGISAELLPHVFEPFWREDVSHSTPGLGLGLPIARRVIELHGGEITVDSQPGQGTTFRVVLPVAAG